MEPDAFNRREVLRMELPSVNGIGEARGIARIYGDMATGGAQLGLGPETIRALEEPATDPTGGRRDLTVHMDTAFSMGYLKPCEAITFGSSSRAYGTPGAGGSLAFADPDAGVGYAYAMNRLDMHNPVDPRELAIRRALYEAIGGPPQGVGVGRNRA